MEQEKTVKMKQITLTILIGIFALNVSAQDIDAPSKHEAKGEDLKLRSDGCPAIYITTSTGINNNTAILGFNFELPVSEKVAIEAGPGTGTWGYKAYAGVKYYLKPCQRGFAFGTGLTYCPGVQHSWHDVATIYGSTEDIEFKKNAQTNIGGQQQTERCADPRFPIVRALHHAVAYHTVRLRRTLSGPPPVATGRTWST